MADKLAEGRNRGNKILASLHGWCTLFALKAGRLWGCRAFVRARLAGRVSSLQNRPFVSTLFRPVHFSRGPGKFLMDQRWGAPCIIAVTHYESQHCRREP